MLLKQSLEKEPLLIVKLQRPSQFQAYLSFKQKTIKSNFDEQKADASLKRMLLKRQKNDKNLQYFKKELKTHERNIKQSPRIKLIQTIKKLISPQNCFPHKGLEDSQELMMIKSIEQSQTQTIRLKQQQKKGEYLRFRKLNNELGISTSLKNKQKNKIVKGSTYRFQNYLKESANSFQEKRRSVQLEKYHSELGFNQQIGEENEETQNIKGNYLQQKDSPKRNIINEPINIFQKLYHRRDLSFKLVQSLENQYSKIQRKYSPDNKNKFSQQNYRITSDQQYKVHLKEFSLTNAGFPLTNGFPMKKVQFNHPQVLTIKMKRSVENRQRKSADRPVRNKKQYYFPNNESCRPNTTIIRGKVRKNSQIQSW